MALTKEDITKLFEELSENIITELKNKLDKDLRHVINSKFAVIFKKIDEVRNTANEALKVAKWTEEQLVTLKENNEKEFSDMRSKLDELVAVNDKLRENVEAYNIKVHVLEKRVEDQTNRSSRKSLVFKGVPERGHETWDDTRDILADVIARNANIDNDEAFEMIERCHRSSFAQQSRSNSKKGRRNIYAAFHSWDDAQYTLEQFRIACIRGRNNSVYVEQRYAATTTAQRNQALIVRKGLKADGTITQGYVTYPAKLMVKYRSNDTKFTLHQDFSEIEVSISVKSSEEE